MLADVTRGGSIDEAYQGAVSSSNLRVGNDHTLPTPGDMVAAAGMNKHRMGLALLRLQTEWAKSARPLPPTPEDIGRLARTYKTETERPHAGKVKVTRGDQIEYILPLRHAKRERWGWHEQETLFALSALRTLPWVRDGMLARARDDGWDVNAQAVAEVLLWWLNPKCPTCQGHKEDVVIGTGRTNGRVCHACKGTGLANQGDPPLGRRGQMLAKYIRGCLEAARSELREGAQRMRRTMRGESKRQNKD
jgi:hypothetical protein